LPKKYPPLTSTQVEAILRANKFIYSHSRGDHKYYYGVIKKKSRTVTLKMRIDVYSNDLLKYMIAQSGLTREEFYGSTKETAKKIGVKFIRR
jgi:predicted RNA binding protein YcfA (HicA-like mRNA interferase family)